ncbi:MAG TPA: hypothetical protein VHM31_09160 [Polyangia bacterium]|nr:hypothetical protein [Polyangia bacterium]
MTGAGAAMALAAALSAGGACSRPRSTPAAASSPPRAAARVAAAGLALPDVPGFSAAPPDPGDGFVRRAYSRGAARVQVTLARMPMSAEDYQRWQSASTAFPQADLGLPAAEANGFYQCGDGQNPSCDLLVQLRGGFHLELRGAGTTSRADVDALARGLPLRDWAGL